MGTYSEYLQSIVNEVARAKANTAAFGAEISAASYQSGGPVPSNTAVENEGGTGTFTNQGTGVTIQRAQTELQNAENPVVQAASAASSPAGRAAAAGGIAGAVFGPMGTILGGAMGVAAQQAYERIAGGASAQQIQQNAPPSAASLDPTAPVDPSTPHAGMPRTPAERAVDTGHAVAHGAAQVTNGKAPPATGRLTPEEEAARLATIGVQGAPTNVKQGVLETVAPNGTKGIQQGVNELGLGGQVVIGGLLALAVLGAVHVYTKRKAGAR